MNTIIFDLGTLTNGKETLDEEMTALLCKLSTSNIVTIITNANWKQLSKQVHDFISIVHSNIYMLPELGGSMYQNWGKYGLVAVYQNKLSTKDIDTITSAIDSTLKDINFEFPQKVWGKTIDIGESRISFCPLGQKAPVEAIEKWDVDCSVRKLISDQLRNKLSGFDVYVYADGINISIKGMNKKYGIDELMKRARISRDDVTYIGTSFHKNSTDYVAVEMGLSHSQVRDLDDTKVWIRKILSGNEITKAVNG